MPSPTDIANMALHRVGAHRIMSIDDEEKGAQVCKDFFESTVKACARMAEWQCLRGRATLARLSQNPAFGWSYAYQLPTDCLLVIKLNGTQFDGEPSDPFDVEGRTLLTDSESAKIEYTAYKAETGDYDPLLVEAIVSKLASQIAVPMRQDEGLAARLREEFERLDLSKARVKTYGEKRRKRANPAADSAFIASRRVSTNG